MSTLKFKQGLGSIVGGFVNVEYGDKINSITIPLGRDTTNTFGSSVPEGRFVTCGYWVVDENFDVDTMKLHADDKRLVYCDDFKNSSGISFGINGIRYVNTNQINMNTIRSFTFTFNNPSSINSNKIFVALISTPEGDDPLIYDVNYRSLTVGVNTDSGSYYYRKSGGINSKTPLQEVNNISLNIELDVTHGVDNSTYINDSKPSQIKCSFLGYRTWSQQNGESQNGWNDGGEKPQSNYERFNDSYTFNEGRLKDIKFANPEDGAYVDNDVNIPRWVFKRSEIKFIIPPSKSSSGKIHNGKIKLRYKIEAPIYNSAYTGEYATKIYDNSGNITIIICPRDEGINDNSEFRVTLDRCFVSDNREISSYSEPITYYFHTYQKPIANIAYPKINRYTDVDKDKIKFSRLLANNTYSNFNGENAILNKYVCDSLSMLVASSTQDASGIPSFVRFYISEYKYGRNGCLNSSGDDFDSEKFKTTQNLFKSNDSNDYTNIGTILAGTASPTAFINGINNCDGSPIMLSGRLTDSNINALLNGQNLKLWTYREWDYVIDPENDVKVGNSWPITTLERDSLGNVVRYKDYNYNATLSPNSDEYKAGMGVTKEIQLNDKIVGDHLGAAKVLTYNSDSTPSTFEQLPSSSLLFRAGYVYLIRIRIFHGAAAGAIDAKYSNINPTIYGIGGKYEYDPNGIYVGDYPGTNDSVDYTTCLTDSYSKYYLDWMGPDDGTTGLGCRHSNVNKTYPGFSEVDYTLFEPICTATSKSNIVTVHPTSPQIGVNQWLTFNYRHLSKNIGEIETYAKNSSGELVSNSFGKTNGGVLNTASRIMSMYSSCTETILNAIDKSGSRYLSYKNLWSSLHDSGSGETPQIVSEKLTLYIKPINNVSCSNRDYKFIESMGRKQQLLEGVVCDLNVPLINAFPANGDSLSNIYNYHFYTHTAAQKNKKGTNDKSTPFTYIDENNNAIAADSGCFAFNEYRNGSSDHYDFSYVDGKNDNHTADRWPEYQIIYLQYVGSSGSANSHKALIEPLGNTYRWQPVINAVKSPTEEIQIQSKCNSNILPDYKSTSTLRNDNTFVHSTNNIELIYESDIQMDYFYEDKYPTTASEINLGNNSMNRFTINEFAGLTNSIEGKGSPGGSVMYTTASTISDIYNKGIISNKYFSLKNGTDETFYGRLYCRVPTYQDVENGTAVNLFGIEAKVNNNQINIDNVTEGDENNFKNITPLVRTTHYLYFKTWINTTFCLKSEVSIKYWYNEGCDEGCSDECNGEHYTSATTDITTMYYKDSSTGFIKHSDMTTAPTIKFGNSTFNSIYGLSEVYGEDNRGWGRCLTADDTSIKKITASGELIDNTSGGVELPIMVRYTPLLQPKVYNEIYSNGGTIKTINSSSKTVTIKYYREHTSNSEGECNENLCVQPIESWDTVTPVVSFTDIDTDNNSSDLTELKSYDIQIYYPYIAEDNTYNTMLPNGGNANNVFYDNYYIDVDTDPTKSIDTRLNDPTTEPSNLDFLGGYGVCTAYNVLLIPSDVNDPETTNNDNAFYQNTNGHHNYFKQSSNYFGCNPSNINNYDLFRIRSKSVKDAGPVLVAYLVGPDDNAINSLDYTDNEMSLSYWWDNCEDSKIKGRCAKTLKLNFKNLLDGIVETNHDISHLNLTDDHKLKSGLTYDLVIVPVYCNDITDISSLSYNFTGSESTAGSLNTTVYGGTTSDAGITKVLAGSNPLVLYDYLQIANIVEGNGSIKNTNDDKPSYVTNYTSDIKECSNCNINASDHAIIFPNVDNELYNTDVGKIKEGPGFWLNNSFKLILRMPSFRTNKSRYGTSDLNTIEHMSNGMLNSDNGDIADDFLFEDIQIHVGKIEELSEYGYPYKMDTDLNTLTTKEELEKAHIISYKHYWDKGVFSKRLKEYDNDDANSKDILTAGALTPDDPNYAHRFIEVNLSNTDLFKNGLVSSHAEGYYIQFRWKSAYCTSDSTQWSDWHGGSFNGGEKWWGDKGLSYFVPVRNYSDVHTEFRNYIKESYPGSLINAKINDKDKDKIVDSNEFTSATIGEGSYVSNKDDISNKGYYHIGVGNSYGAKIVPDISPISGGTANNHLFTNNHDNPYYDEISYRVTHDTNFTIPTNISNLHQQMWEMLYVDYIVRNMCKLYYKPNHNDVTTEKISGYSSSVKNCNLAVPYHKGTKESIKLNYHCVGWDNIIYSTTASNKKLVSQSGPNKAETTSGGQRWNRNKYYRKMITKDDFDKLNSHLKELIEFTRHEELAGKESKTPIYGNIDVLLRDENFINFDRLSRLLIGNTTDTTSGHSETNNINFKMMGSNYIQNIWQNILSICKPGSRVTYKNTKTGR